MRRRTRIGGRTAMLDLVFILLAFVVAVSTVRKEEARASETEELRIRLPASGEGAEDPAPSDDVRLRIRLRGEDTVYVGRSRVPVRGDEALRRAVRRGLPADRNRVVVEIDAAPQVPLRTALRVVESLRSEGLARVLFLAFVEPAPEEAR